MRVISIIFELWDIHFLLENARIAKEEAMNRKAEEEGENDDEENEWESVEGKSQRRGWIFEVLRLKYSILSMKLFNRFDSAP